MKKLVHIEDGRAVVTTLAEDMSEDAIAAYVARLLPSVETPHMLCEAEILPANRQLLDQWALDYGLLQSLPVGYLDKLKARKIAAAWERMEALTSTGAVAVATSAGTHSYGIDPATRQNLLMAGLGISLGITANPRLWTPKGAQASITVTHADLTAIAQAVGNAYDALIQAYLAHKSAILGLVTAELILAYDINTGWPA